MGKPALKPGKAVAGRTGFGKAESVTRLFVMTMALLSATPVFAQEKSPSEKSSSEKRPSLAGVAPTTNVAPAEAAANRVMGYTAWDDDYLYIALIVNKPTVKGENSAPYSNPLKDDAAIIAIQTDNDHRSTRRTAHTVTVVVSATGGAQLYMGAEATPLFKGLDDLNRQLEEIAKNEPDASAQQAKRAALLSKILKFAVTLKGAARPSGANLPGYTLEVAVPWADLGGKPGVGAKMGFHVATQSITPGSPPVQSLSSTVAKADDLDAPSRWGQIVFSNAPGRSEEGTLVCPRVFNARPVIDGEIGNGEWNGLSAFAFGGGNEPPLHTVSARVHPEFVPHPPRLALPTDPSVDASRATPQPPHRPQPVAPLVIARYLYGYQADPRKAAPVESVTRPDGSTALTHHPLDGVGPWFSYDRADWHRHQLQELRRAGVDVILPVFRGTPRDRQLYATKGLTVLAATLQALQISGQDYPQVGLYVDTTALEEMVGAKPDLRAPATQATLYSLIRDFYRQIPTPFRCVIPLSAANGGRTAYPVFLSDASLFGALDSTFVPYLRGRFLADFGADLVVLGAGNFKPKAALDGYFAETKEKGFAFDSDGWIKVASVGAGYDNTLADSTSKPLPRHGGDTYRANWTAALARRPDWILLAGWNDYGAGAEIAPTLESGYSAEDITREFARRFAGFGRIGCKFLWHNAPTVLLPQHTYALRVRAQNTGVLSWSSSPGADQIPLAFAYRWKRNGQIVATGASTSLPASIPPMQNVDLELPVQTSLQGGAALPPGDYTLEIGPVGGEKGGEKKGGIGVWESDSAENRALQIPVRIGVETERVVPLWAATLVRTDLPMMLENGSVYPVVVTLRNDGALPWRKADGARITLHLTHLAAISAPNGAPNGLTEDPLHERPVPAADATAELTEDVSPGQETTVRVLLPLTDPLGKLLPVWSQDDLWTYAIRCEVAMDRFSSGLQGVALAAPKAPLAAGVRLPPIPIAVVDFDFGVRFTTDATPAFLPGDRRQPVRLSLQNLGPQTWRQEGVRVGYHWYYQDGTELLWEDETTQIPQDVPPGGSITDMLAYVTAPPQDGTYWLVWDVKVGDTWASTTASTHLYDESVRSVQVIGGKLRFVDLSKAYNVAGITEDDDLAGGDFDGQGHTFPAALLPPYVNLEVVPAAMWLPSAKSGLDSPRRISFRWGPSDSKQKNFIACKGQRVELGKSSGTCHLLHIVAASTGEDVVASLKLIFQEPTSQSEDLFPFAVSRWDRPPSRGEEVVVLARRHHAREGVQPGAIALYHYVITIKEPRKLVALQLPNNPAIKIAAITLEQ